MFVIVALYRFQIFTNLTESLYSVTASAPVSLVSIALLCVSNTFITFIKSGHIEYDRTLQPLELFRTQIIEHVLPKGSEKSA